MHIQHGILRPQYAVRSVEACRGDLRLVTERSPRALPIQLSQVHRANLNHAINLSVEKGCGKLMYMKRQGEYRIRDWKGQMSRERILVSLSDMERHS